MHKITFQLEGGGDETIYASPGENLLDLARKANVAIDAPCSGNGSCGKCRIRLLQGSVESVKSIHLPDSDFLSGWRLACACTITGEASVLIPDIASAYRSRMKTADLSSDGERTVFDALQAELEKANLPFGNGICSFTIRMQPPDSSDTMPDNERLLRALAAVSGIRDIRIPFFAMKRLPATLRDNGFEVRCVCERRGDNLELLHILPARDTTSTCGLAIDLGTTSVSGLLVDLETGKILAKASTGNGQIRYGADVINRIIEQQKPGGADLLQDAVVNETIVPLIDCLCAEGGVTKERIYRMTIASNTTMNHLLLGVDADALRTEPYVPAFFVLEPVSTADIGIALAPNAVLQLAPNIGSYVGGDITAGTLASMMWNRPELSLLIDLGTNGEIVFGNNEFLVACACSAGPAFEGGDISCGMRATDGAIEACTIDRGTLGPSMTVIGDQKPVGLCGSGIIDVIAELFGAGAIDARGRFFREHERIRSDEFGISRLSSPSLQKPRRGGKYRLRKWT